MLTLDLPTYTLFLLPSGVAAIATLTGLKTLHLIQRDDCPPCAAPLPIQAISLLSSLTALTHLKAGGLGAFSSTGLPAWETEGGLSAEEVSKQQAEQWLIALSAMKQLRRLHVCDTVLRDPLLLAVKAAGLPHLQQLIINMGYRGFDAAVTEEGAQAVAHIPHIELHCQKMFDCKPAKPFVELPNVKGFSCAHFCYIYSGGCYKGVPWMVDSCCCSYCCTGSESCKCGLCEYRKRGGYAA